MRRILSVGTVLLSFQLLAAVREVTVTDIAQEGEVITAVALSVSPGEEPVFLSVAKDALDRGAEPSAWKVYEEGVKEFPASETALSYVYRPESPDKAYRFFLIRIASLYKCKLDYLQATGTQSVLTDYKPHDGIKVEADVTLDDTIADECLWGCRKAARDSAFLVFRLAGSQSGKLRFDVAESIAATSSSAPTTGVRHTFIANGNQLSCDDTIIASSSAARFTSSYDLALFALNQPSGVSLYSKSRIHSFKLWDDKNDETSLVLDLVPCVREDDSYAFYNRVNGTFLTTSSAGDSLVPSVETSPCTDVKKTLLFVSDSVVATSSNQIVNGGFEIVGEADDLASGWTGGIRVKGETTACPLQTDEGFYALSLRTTSAPRTTTSFTVDQAGYYRLSFKLATSQLSWVAAANVEVYLDDAAVALGSAYAFRDSAWNTAEFRRIYLSAGSHTLKLKAERVFASDPLVLVDDVRLLPDLTVSKGFTSAFSGIPEGMSTEGLLTHADVESGETGGFVVISANRFTYGGKIYKPTGVIVSVGGNDQMIAGSTYAFRFVAGRESTQLTWNYVPEEGGGILPNPSFENNTQCSGDRVANVGPYYTDAWQGGIINRGNGQVYCRHDMADGTFGIALHPSYSTLSCSFNAEEEGDYRLSFFLTARPMGEGECSMCVDVSFDGADSIGTALPTSASHWSCASFSGVHLTEGAHTITFTGRLKSGVKIDASSVLDAIILERDLATTTGSGYSSSFSGLPAGADARSALSRPDPSSGIYGTTCEVTAGTVRSHHNVYAVESIDITLGGVTRRVNGNVYTHVFSDAGPAEVKWNFVAQGILPNPSFEDETVCPGDRGINGQDGYSTKSWTGGQINHSFGQIFCFGHAMADGYYGMQIGASAAIPALSCVFEVGCDGLYELSFQISARGDEPSCFSGSTVFVAFDGADDPLMSARPTSPRDWDTCVSTVRLSAGQHTIKFWPKSGEQNGTIIDNVILKLVKPKQGLMLIVR